MTPLPIDAYLSRITGELAKARSLVLVAPPGAGKTTRVPPAIVREGLLSAEHPNLVMLQPRRVAARASAQRIAEENGWELGREVGYHVRFDRKLGDRTRIRVLTEGILTRQLLDDPFLPGVGAVLLDEFHERSLHTDIAIALLREVQQTVREDLKLVVMSATLDAEPVATFLEDCPIVRTEGRTFPVEVVFAGSGTTRPHEHLTERVVDAVIGVLNSGSEGGDILVFLPGAEEIRRTERRLEALAAEHDLLVLPLHGSLPAEEQTRALRPARQRKVILATNIAETSLTIDGVRTVIDSGLARVAGYDPRRGLDRLELKRISKASATQRAGRAGRTAPGRCIRLWSQAEDRFLAEFELPEIRRVDLCSTVLALHSWGQTDARKFGWYEAPSEQAVAAAERLLEMLGALTAESNGKITPLGRQILSLPVHPRLARLLIDAAGHGLLREGASFAALLSEKDIVRAEPSAGPRQRVTQGPSDLLVRLDLLERAEQSHFAAHLRDGGIDPIAARQVVKTRDELLRVARRLSTVGKGAEEQLLKLPLLAYPDRVCRRRGESDRGVMVGGGGVKLALESVTRGEFFLALDARHDERSQTREAVVRMASEVRAEWLEELFPQEIRREREVVYDGERDRVVGRAAVYYRDLLVSEDLNAAIDPAKAAVALAEAAKLKAVEIFAANESAAGLLARVALLREKMPEHAWPKFDEGELVEVLAEAARGKRSIEELRRATLTPLLMNRLAWPLDRLLEEHAPESIAVPTGNRIRVNYAAGQAPVLAVRLQELFGWTDTPRIAGGRVAVVLHLLGPNYRPVQITDDLRSFWGTTYFQVRKDLRVRYPKHSWPEDPLTAKAVARGRSTK